MKLQLAGHPASSGCSFDAIKYFLHSREYILTGADVNQPRHKSLLQIIIEFLNSKGRP